MARVAQLPRRFFGVKFTMSDFQDQSWSVEGDVGENLMRAGIAHGVPFLVACGGNAECCTCHVYLTKEVMNSQDYTDPEDAEMDALDFAEDTKDESRLACQFNIIAELEGQDIRLVSETD